MDLTVILSAFVGALAAVLLAPVVKQIIKNISDKI